jgi:RHS repeat-associated protein
MRVARVVSAADFVRRLLLVGLILLLSTEAARAGCFRDPEQGNLKRCSAPLPTISTDQTTYRYPTSVQITVSGTVSDFDGSGAALTRIDVYTGSSAQPKQTLIASIPTPSGSTAYSTSFSWVPPAPGPYTLYAFAVDDGGALGPNSAQTSSAVAVANINEIVNRATVSSQSVPATMVPGQTYAVSVTMVNSGTTTWAQSGFYRLAPVGAGSGAWSIGRVELPVASVSPGQSVVFNFNVVAPAGVGTYNFQWQMVQEFVEFFGDATPLLSINVTRGNDAVFSSQVVPPSMTQGQTVPVTVSMTNTGTSTWTGGLYYLASVGAGASAWSVVRAELPTGPVGPVQRAVSPGQTVTFTFNVVAPNTPGTYNFQWQMVQDGVEVFGAAAPNVTVNVVAAINGAAYQSQVVPSTMQPGQTYPITVMMTNTGTSTWTQANSYRLGSAAPPGSTWWTTVRAELPVTSVAPGASATFTFNVTAPSTAGTYTFQWQMLQELVEWFGAPTAPVVVTVAAPPPPPPSGGITPPNLAGPLAGSSNGSAAVDALGNATYSIPVAVPPGTGAVTPTLSLNYKSSGEDGIFGRGWTLAGFSQITRCRRTLAQDAYAGAVRLDTNDRFCLDGERLIVVSGTYGADNAEYRTERDSFARVISHTTSPARGPDSFTVSYKDGRIASYGTNGLSTDSVQIAQGTSPSINLAWGIGRVEDRHSNYALYFYAQNANGEFYLTKIAYGGNAASNQSPYNAIRLAYAWRPDSTLVKYIAGSQVLTAQRVFAIQSFVNTDADGNSGTLVRELRLSYSSNPQSKTNLLTSAADCDGSGICLPATQFEWQQRSAADDVYTASNWGGMPYSGTSDNLKNTILRGDFNGDGRLDLISTDGSGNFNVCLSTGSSFSCQNWTGPAVPITGVLFGDFDGDGRTDLFIPPNAKAPLRTPTTYTICLADEVNHNFACQGWAGWNYGQGISHYQVGDFTGDGRDDVALIGFDSTSALCSSTGTQVSGFTCVDYNGFAGAFNLNVGDDTNVRGWPSLVDVDGDGRLDVVTYFDTVSLVNFNNGWGAFPAGDTSIGLSGFDGATQAPRNTLFGFPDGTKLVDHNGDGYADIGSLYATRDPNTGAVSDPIATLCRSNGKAFVCRNWSIDTSYTQNVWAHDWAIGDVDGDGIPDFVQMLNGSVHVCRLSLDQSLNNVSNCSTWSAPDPTGLYGPFVGDFTGRGRVEFAWYSPTAAGWVIYAPGGESTDRLAAATDGFGARTEFTYTSTSSAFVYTKGTGASYPMRDSQPATYVVSEIRRDNGQGGFLSTDYLYGGFRTDLTGRGPLGFASIDAHDSMPNVATHTEYAQAFPFTGMSTKAVKTHTTFLSRRVRSIVELDHQEMTLDKMTTANAAVLFPFVSSSTRTIIDLDGSPVATTTVQVPAGSYDGFGNLLSGTMTATAGTNSYTASFTNVFDNLTASWLIGLPRQAVETRSTPGAADITRTRTMDFDAVGTLIRTTVEPGDPTLTLTTNYGHDVFGNVTIETKSWTDPATLSARSRDTERSTFDVHGRWATTVTNALNQSVVRTRRDADGALTSRTDANGVATTWSYDGFGRKTAVIRSDGTSTTWDYRQCVVDCYGSATNVHVTQELSGTTMVSAPTEEFSDRVGHSVQTRTWGFDGRQMFTQRSYDVFGRLQAASRPFFLSAPVISVTNYAYDDLGRKTTQLTPSSNGSALTSTTAYHGLSVTTQNAKLQQRTVTRNAFGKPATIVDRGGFITLYAYDGFGNLVRTTDAKGNQVAMVYDRLGRKTQLNDPDLGINNFSVNPLGLVWRQVDAKGQITTSTFDDLNRITHRVEADLDSNWIYDTAAHGIGKLAEAFTLLGNGAKDYDRVHTYDSLSRLSTTNIRLDQDYLTTYEYDALGRRSSARSTRNTINGSSGPSVAFVNNYNANGYLQNMQSSRVGGRTEWTAVAQDAELRVTREQLGDGLFTDRAFNVYTGTLDAIHAGADDNAGGDNGSLEQDSYGYDELNQMTSRSQRKPDGTPLLETFTYDNLNRLASSQVAALAGKTYTYDEIGNLLSKTGVGNYSYPVSGAGSLRPHAVTSISGSVASQSNPTFGYDANGNLMSGANRTITWTSFDMPASITRTLSGATSATNVALASNGGVATASSTINSSYPIEAINDGVRGGPNWNNGGVGSGWNDATNDSYPDWVQVDFVGPRSINEIDVFTCGDTNCTTNTDPSTVITDGGITDFVVQYWDGSNWVTVTGGNVTGNNKVARQFNFAAVTTSKVRVTVNNAVNASQYKYSRITEVEAWTPGAGASTNTAAFSYGPEHERVKQTVTGTNPITIYYAGAIEKEMTNSGTTIKTRMPGDIGYIEESTADATPRGRYVRGDHLGSSVVMTDESGAVLDRLSYDPWGQRRNPDGSDDGTYSFAGRDRIGYTDEEELDTVGLVHLNGRVYDPLVGRFISADPTIPYIDQSQSFNRFAYVRNNPLNKTDPTGYADILDGIDVNGPPLPKPTTCTPNCSNQGIVSGSRPMPFGGFAAATATFGPRFVPVAITVTIEFFPAAVPLGIVVGGAAACLSNPSSCMQTTALGVLWGDPGGAEVIAAMAANGSTLQPGPNAGDSIPARGPDRDFTPDERAKINDIGNATGCHTCGTTDPGTKSGNFVPDHQPPSALNPDGGSQNLYPQCLSCSRVQGGQVRGATGGGVNGGGGGG